jgi:predicted transcriptional regulator
MSDTAPKRARSSTGEFAESYPAEEFIAAVRDHTPASTKEVAETVGCTRQNADYRLRRLQDTGSVRSKKVGASLVWMLTDTQEVPV